ncbi:Heat-inducible transcription repressor HrcA [Lutibaculum baratangense AMV1]|uniref:Heat-inducible transcription repressor HrcA n=2 Tax=Lutibaculum TaxID=1358438 RepID=V4TJ43_9HYPH|nr:Heat-inducible transcription repressor HrcA [Lutibaculum baratangense AMV1]
MGWSWRVLSRMIRASGFYRKRPFRRQCRRQGGGLPLDGSDREKHIKGRQTSEMTRVHRDITSGFPMRALADLDQRSREIFRRIVESYLETGEPVGSRNLSRVLSSNLSPASVRNVMSDLEALGLIYSPHTSAGRLPTEIGLRFFVDALLEFGDLTQDDRASIESRIRTGHPGRSIESVLTEAGDLLSGLSRGAGLVLAGKSDLRLKHIEFVRLEPRRLLVILVSVDGNVENRVLTLDEDIPSSTLVEVANYLNARMQGRGIDEVRAEIERSAARVEAELDMVGRRLVEGGLATWAGVAGERPPTLIVRGSANLLEDLKALEDLERIRVLIDDLEKKKDIVELLTLADEAEGVRIFIGSETQLFSLSGSSVVVAPYRDSEQRIVGVLGVIGPTRLNYARVVPMVDYTAQVVGRLLD